MKICHVTSVHPWDDTRIFHKMCRSLAGEGHEVHIVATRGPELQGAAADGVRIHLLKPPRSRFERMWRTSRHILSYARMLEADLYHFHDPEFLPWARRFQKRVGAPVVYDAHEDYRVHMDKPWIPPALQRIASRGVGYFEDTVVRSLAGVVSATPHIARRFKGQPNSVVVQNFPRIEEFASVDPEAAREESLFVYVGGTFSEARGIIEMIQALPLADSRARLALAGRWLSEELRARCAKLKGWAQVEELGFLDRQAITELLSRARAGLVVLHGIDSYSHSYPVKLFEYMAAGLPVIASDFALWREIIGDAGCGLLVDPMNPEAIGEAMRWMIEHPDQAQAMGIEGRKKVLRQCAWASQFLVLELLYQTLVGLCR